MNMLENQAKTKKLLQEVKNKLQNNRWSQQPIALNLLTGNNSAALNARKLEEEYDPLRPNEYAIFFQKMVENKRYLQSLKAAAEAANKPVVKEVVCIGSDSDSDCSVSPPAKRIEIAPPRSLIKNDARDDPSVKNIKLVNLKSGVDSGKSVDKSNVAKKIMERMGYKAGQGLGKKEQGMSSALKFERTNSRFGKIVQQNDLSAFYMSIPESNTNSNLLKNPTKVVVLLNMVPPGTVDPNLEAETAQECSKFGKISKCLIFEIPEDGEEAVRIFIEFEKINSAVKAVGGMNGRYFGGRVVKARFYNLDHFRRLDFGQRV